MSIDPFRLESAVIELGHDIARCNPFSTPVQLDAVVRETLLAVTASRVRWELACEIVAGLLALVEIRSDREGRAICIESDAMSAVAGRHRHPSRYKASLDSLFACNGRLLIDISDRICSGVGPTAIRRDLIRRIPGLGPKAASLLLRNFGLGESLAVLDIHLLDFMRFVGLSFHDRVVATVASYESVEKVFLAYAKFRQIRADALDLAAWIVVRSMKERYRIEHRNTSFGRTGFDLGRGSSGGGKARSIPSFH
jgi:hypothetical protein